MTNPVNPTPLLPQGAIPPELLALSRFVQDLIQSLFREMQSYAFRLNLALPKDGSERMQNPLPLVQFTVGTLPAASAWTGAIIYVSDGTSNKRLAISDGTNWRWPDGAIVS